MKLLKSDLCLRPVQIKDHGRPPLHTAKNSVERLTISQMATVICLQLWHE